MTCIGTRTRIHTTLLILFSGSTAPSSHRTNTEELKEKVAKFLPDIAYPVKMLFQLKRKKNEI